MKKLRIILVFMEPPLPFGNAGARWFYVLLKGLVERGHRVTAFSGCSRPREMKEVQKWFPSDRFDLRVYPLDTERQLGARWERFRKPYSYVFGPDLQHDLKRELEQDYDILHLEQLWTGWLGLEHVQRALLNIHYSFTIDTSAEPPKSLSKWALGLRTRHAEKYLLRKYRWITTLSPRLSDFATNLHPGGSIFTVPLGLDSSLYPFGTCSDDRTIGLIGSFNWMPSYAAGVRLLERLWPRIHKEVPDAKLQIVGRAARSAFEAYRNLPGVTFEEDVPDILPYFRSLSVLLYAPPVGSGMKTKILEAFALGIPVVTNSEGVEGLRARDGVHAGIADDDDTLVQKTVELLRDRSLALRMASNARALVEQCCSPETTVGSIEGIYRTMLTNSSSKANALAPSTYAANL